MPRRIVPKSTYYDILGVSSSATQEEIKKSFVELSKRHHPDRPDGDVELSKKINAAYTVLSRPETRRGYDAQLDKDIWRPPSYDNDAGKPRPSTYEDMNKMYGFPSQANYQAAGRHSKNLLVSFCIFMAVGVGFSVFLKYRDHVRPLEENEYYSSIDNENYLNGDIVARRAARSHRRVRERARELGGFDERLRYIENKVLKHPENSDSEK